jgi:hypothetical protein
MHITFKNAKLLTLFLMMPLMFFSIPSSKFFKEKIHPEFLKPGMNIEAFTRFFVKDKSSKLEDVTTLQKLKCDAVDIDNISIKEALVISDSGIITRLSLILNKKQGAKFRSNVIQKYGMPIGEIIDVYAWKINNVVSEIDETEVGFIVTYKPVGR